MRSSFGCFESFASGFIFDGPCDNDNNDDDDDDDNDDDDDDDDHIVMIIITMMMIMLPTMVLPSKGSEITPVKNSVE